jgi:tellurite resistance protein TerC
LGGDPLFLALVVINLADLVFAVDSVPAIFAITTDTFIVYTSNIMAILACARFISRWRRWCTASTI